MGERKIHIFIIHDADDGVAYIGSTTLSLRECIVWHTREKYYSYSYLGIDAVGGLFDKAVGEHITSRVYGLISQNGLLNVRIELVDKHLSDSHTSLHMRENEISLKSLREAYNEIRNILSNMQRNTIDIEVGRLRY